MKTVSTFVAFLALTALAACNQQKDEQSSYDAAKETAEDQTTAVTEEQSEAVVDELETATSETEGVLDAIKDEVGDVISEAVRIDASSLDSFQESLSAMRASLSLEDQARLSAALSNLMPSAPAGEGGVLGAAKSATSGLSMEERLFDAMGSTLNGMTFDDILALAG